MGNAAVLGNSLDLDESSLQPDTSIWTGIKKAAAKSALCYELCEFFFPQHLYEKAKGRLHTIAKQEALFTIFFRILIKTGLALGLLKLAPSFALKRKCLRSSNIKRLLLLMSFLFLFSSRGCCFLCVLQP